MSVHFILQILTDTDKGHRKTAASAPAGLRSLSFDIALFTYIRKLCNAEYIFQLLFNKNCHFCHSFFPVF